MSPLDAKIDALGRLLARLSCKQIGMYFAVCGERLLPLYRHFHRKEAWGDPGVLLSALDSVWSALGGAAESDWPQLIAEIERITPHADDFDNLAVTGAQDACFLIDSAVRSLDEDPIPDALEYAFEPLRMAVCFEETGNLQLGGGVESERFESALMDNEFIQKELEFQERLIGRIASWTEGDSLAVRNLVGNAPIRLPGFAP